MLYYDGVIQSRRKGVISGCISLLDGLKCIKREHVLYACCAGLQHRFPVYTSNGSMHNTNSSNL